MLKKDFLILLRSTKARIVLILFAILIILSIAISFDEEKVEPVVTLGISNHDDSEYSTMLIGFFDQNEIFTSYVSIIVGDDESLQTRFSNGEIDMLLTIPQGFAESLKRLENLPVKALINSSDETKAILLNNLMEAYENLIFKAQIGCQTLFEIMRIEGRIKSLVESYNNDISYDLIFTALGKDAFFERVELERLKSIPLTRYYLFSVIFVLILYGGLFAGMNLLNEYRKGTLVRLKSTGVSVKNIIFMKLLFFTLIFGTLSLYTLFTFGFLVFLFIFLFSIASICIFFLMATFIKKAQNYLLISNFLILIFTILGGGIIPIMYMPESLSQLAYFTPNYWFLRIILSIENGANGMNLPLCVLLVFCFIALSFLFIVIGTKKREGKVYATT